MQTDCWHIHADTGFLIHPAPLKHLAETESPLAGDTISCLETAATSLSRWITDNRARCELARLPLFDYSMMRETTTDPRLLERLWLLYGYFANGYLLSVHDTPTQILPANLALPLTQLSDYLKRPPILSYAGMVLNNWRWGSRADDITPENLDILQTFTLLADERWFFLVHVAIEARAGGILQSIRDAIAAVEATNHQGVMRALRAMIHGLVDLVKIFHRMPEGCDADTYYQQVRPYMFGFSGVIYEGVSAEPQTWRGGSGAQSSVVPAVLAALGIRHEQSELTAHLQTMNAYMPLEHRQFITELHDSPIRAYCADKLMLKEAYNNCLRQLMTFRRAHLYYAKTYIFEKSTNPIGTGGTVFMDFLSKLIHETEAQLL